MKKKTVKKTHQGKKKSKKTVSQKLDQVLAVEKNLLKKEEQIAREEKILEKEEKRIEKIDVENKKGESKENIELKKIEQEIASKEAIEENELEKLEKLEEEIKQDVGEHPLAKITLKDFLKGMVGAFIGLAIHYTFVYGVEISENISFARATLFFPLTFIIGGLFIYATGFRKIKDPGMLIFIPLRLIVLYIAALLMSILVLFLFYPDFGLHFIESYKMVAGVMLAAIVGACTADLIGKE